MHYVLRNLIDGKLEYWSSRNRLRRNSNHYANKNKWSSNTNLIQNEQYKTSPCAALSLAIIFLRDSIQNNSVPIPFSGPCANLPSSRFNYDLICKIDDSYFHERARAVRADARCPPSGGARDSRPQASRRHRTCQAKDVFHFI